MGKYKKAKRKEINPDKIGRGHAFGRPGKGRSTMFKDKSKYLRKDKKNNDGSKPIGN